MGPIWGKRRFESAARADKGYVQSGEKAPQRRNQELIVLRAGGLWIYNTISVSIGQILELPDAWRAAKATGNRQAAEAEEDG